MVGDTVDNVNIPKIPEAWTGEFAALKTPRHALLFGTLTEPMTALRARGKYPVGETAVATDFFDRNSGFPGDSE
jgi:hypothetical protein